MIKSVWSTVFPGSLVGLIIEAVGMDMFALLFEVQLLAIFLALYNGLSLNGKPIISTTWTVSSAWLR